MRIGVDARFYSEQGHGRYLRNLIAELAKIDNENEYIIFLREKDYTKFQLPNSNFKKVLAEVRWYTLREQTILLKIFLDAKLDLLHVPHFNVPIFYTRPFIVTIHDLTITHFPSIRSTTLPLYLWKIKRIGYHISLRLSLMRAKHIIAVSNFTKQDILRDYPSIKEKKISVIHEAIAEEFVKQSARVLVDDPNIARVKKSHGISKQYLLYIGNVHPHKNIERFIRVFHKLQSDLSGNIQLVLVGKDDYFMKRLKMENEVMANGKSIVWTGFVPDEDLIPLFKGAACFVFPSLTEGFGIPPLEAMACGTPTVVSNAGSLPEVCGDASAYFNPTDEKEMYDVLKEVLEDEALRLTLIQKGYEQVKKYSWKKLTEETLKVYNKVI